VLDAITMLLALELIVERRDIWLPVRLKRVQLAGAFGRRSRPRSCGASAGSSASRAPGSRRCCASA
jgi:hypothetical protein